MSAAGTIYLLRNAGQIPGTDPEMFCDTDDFSDSYKRSPCKGTFPQEGPPREADTLFRLRHIPSEADNRGQMWNDYT